MQLFGNHSRNEVPIRGYLDAPVESAPQDPFTLKVDGWVQSTTEPQAIEAVEFLADGEMIGRTTSLFSRPDVSRAYSLPPEVKTGFQLFLSVPHLRGKTVRFTVIVCLAGGVRLELTARRIQFADTDLLQEPFGHLLDKQHDRIARRADIFASGPSVAGGSEELLSLLERYLVPPPAKVLDVGCGLGFYGERLLRLGYDWLGIEPKEQDAAALASKQLPHRRADGYNLPFEAGQFENVIALEVLEHTTDPDRFVGELARVTRKRAIFSVPNAELIPYMYCHAAVPWHMLEGDHQNFFTRASLHAVLAKKFSTINLYMYGTCPLKSVFGSSLYYNLLAVADR